MKQEPSNNEQPDENAISWWAIFSTFFRIGLFTLGGGVAMLPVMRYELVTRRGWLDDDEFIGMTSLATAVPGAIAVNMAYLQGRRFAGAAGVGLAILGTVLPSFGIILLVAAVIPFVLDNPYVVIFFRGCAIAVAGQIAFAGVTFARRLVKRWHHVIPCLTAVVVLVIGSHPLWAIVIAAVVGLVIDEISQSTCDEADDVEGVG